MPDQGPITPDLAGLDDAEALACMQVHAGQLRAEVERLRKLVENQRTEWDRNAQGWASAEAEVERLTMETERLRAENSALRIDNENLLYAEGATQRQRRALQDITRESQEGGIAWRIAQEALDA